MLHSCFDIGGNEKDRIICIAVCLLAVLILLNSAYAQEINVKNRVTTVDIQKRMLT
jgi:hypothetical protein